MPNFSAPRTHNNPDMQNMRTNRHEMFAPPPRNARRTEVVPTSLRISSQARHSRSAAMAETCQNTGVRMDVRMGSEDGRERQEMTEEELARVEEAKERQEQSREEHMRAEEGKVANERRDIERQDAVTKDAAKNDIRTKRACSVSKTLNPMFTWVGFASCFYLGVFILSIMLVTTLYLAFCPPSAFTVMTVSRLLSVLLLRPDANYISST
jgi:hypothetical protein